MARRLRTLFILALLFSTMGRGQTFSEFIGTLTATRDSLAKSKLIDQFLLTHEFPFIEGSEVHFVYRGKGTSVAVPGELNGWAPSKAPMERIPQTDFFHRMEIIPTNARVEYKIWVDSAWMLDPLNPRKARGGFGENSDVWMPGYTPSEHIKYHPDISHGRIETLMVKSEYLGRTHPILVYVPAGATGQEKLPTIFVTDGGEYISLGLMNNVLDNLIASKRISPVIGVFVDPRTDLNDNSTNQRMTEYAANDSFLNFLEKEVAPLVEQKYSVSNKPSVRLILGASMGGLISTYAVLKRPEFVTNCAAQSPAYLQAGGAVMKLVETIDTTTAKVYIDTGLFHDTQVEAKLVAEKLKAKGAEVSYAEYPEGHNWTNWRARFDRILQHFYGVGR